MYAIFQHGGPIFGVDKTGYGALENARQFAQIADDVDDYVPGASVDGAMYCAPISYKLETAVKESGGHVPYDIVDGWLVDPSEV